MASDELDWSRVGELRPGTPLSELAEPLGGAAEVAEDAEGGFSLLDGDDEICSGSVNEDGIVDGLTFGDPRVVVEGLQPQMSLAHLRALVGDLVREYSDEARESKATDDLDTYWAPHSQGLAWHFFVSDDEVLTISLFAIDEPIDAPDPVFEDLNFKLVVVDRLCALGLVELPDAPTAEARLHACLQMEIEAAQLHAVDELTIETSLPIYTHIDPRFDGSGHAFNVVSLEGIAQLRALGVLSIAAMTPNLSLAPLAHHPSLQRLELSSQPFKDFGALELIASLTRVAGFFAEMYEDDHEALDRLAARGVEVESYD